MIDFSNFDHRILYPEPVDMRKGPNHFSSTISLFLDMDPYDQSSIYFFINKRHNLIKAFQFDGQNPWVMQVRKSSGTFKWKDWCTVIGTELTTPQIESLLNGQYPSRHVQ